MYLKYVTLILRMLYLIARIRGKFVRCIIDIYRQYKSDSLRYFKLFISEKCRSTSKRLSAQLGIVRCKFIYILIYLYLHVYLCLLFIMHFVFDYTSPA